MNKSSNHRDQEHSLKVLDVLEQNSASTQRELSKHMNLSLGKVNYILSSLIKTGWVKAQRFKNSKNKRAYLYVLTTEGIKKKAILMVQFLERKTKEYEALKHEIEELKQSIKDKQIS
jgi:MarR family transcriptional regulator, temperature-dependent positive regulator of motility